ncbi:Protein of unknown function [Bacillus wiedmannii]|uniref:Uncharacterized protein n=1 Tax=Bacillus wiedmannii TaxID=1890302 RepID=A0AB37YTP7_9BACI|nr:Protein of unknown function [Bacillus wiedmannii]
MEILKFEREVAGEM